MEDTIYQISPPLLFVSWGLDDPAQPLRFGLLARQTESGNAIDLITLSSSPGIRVVLGGLVDQAQNVRQWFELWIQSPHTVGDTPAGRAGLLNNALLDEEWKNALEAARACAPERFIATVWEQFLGSEPLGLDLKRRAILPLVHAVSKKPLVLEREDAVLKTAGLAPYSDGLERWFRTLLPNGETKWMAHRNLVPGNTSSPEESVTFADGNAWNDFNSSGGAMSLRTLAPLRLERFSAWLSAQARGADPVSTQVSSSKDADPLADWESRSLLATTSGLVGKKSAAPPFDTELNAWSLRLALWSAVVAETTRISAAQNRPFFNLTADSFRISRGVGSHFRVHLVKPSEAIPFEAESGAPSRFAPTSLTLSSGSLHRFGGWQMGEGTVRFSQFNETEAGVKLEGSLDSNALRDATADTFIWGQVPLESQVLGFEAEIEGDQSGALAGLRFKAMVTDLPDGALARLKSALSRRRPCKLSLVNAIDPALDIHLLGKIGLQLLLVQDASAAAELEDDLFELSALVPRHSGIEPLRALAASPETNPRLVRLLTSSDWRIRPDNTPVPDQVWYALVQELMEFVAVEESRIATGDKKNWWEPLQNRCQALENLSIHIQGLLSPPHPMSEEIAQLVQRFVRKPF